MNISLLLSAPGLDAQLRHRAGPLTAHVDGVRFVGDLDALAGVDAGVLALLAPAAAADVITFRFDVALRTAASRALGAIAFVGGDEIRLSHTAIDLAERGGVAVLSIAPDADLADIAFRVRAEILGGADLAAARLTELIAALDECDTDEVADPTLVLERVQEAIGTRVELTAEPVDEGSLPVEVDGIREGFLTTNDQAQLGAASARLVRDALMRAIVRARRREEAPIESRAELLTEFLYADSQRAGSLLHRMRTAGVPIDGWHVACRLSVEPGANKAADNELARQDAAALMARLAVDAARAHGGQWFRADATSHGMLLLRSERSELRPAELAATTRTTARVLERLRERLPGAEIVAGVSSVHAGAGGLRTAVAEARSAAGMAKASKRDEPVLFDAVGVRRMLVEWYASETNRQEVAALLAPLDALGEQKARTALATLRCYLDNQGSLSKTASELHLHRNAVSYRISRIQETLDVDLNDPDQRLILQLACRARAFL